MENINLFIYFSLFSSKIDKDNLLIATSVGFGPSVALLVEKKGIASYWQSAVGLTASAETCFEYQVLLLVLLWNQKKWWSFD